MNKSNKKHLLVSLFVSSLLYIPLSQANPKAIEAFDKNDHKAAKVLFTEALKNNSKDITALQYLAKLMLIENEFDDAEDYIEKALKLAPDNPEIQFISARVMGAQAQDSSIFSAPGYAKKALNGFKQAAKLEPDNIKYHQGLMSFYLNAPGIVGGDIELAKVEAKAIMALDPAKGYIAMANIYHTTEDEKLIAHYAQLETDFADNAPVLMNRAMYYQSEEKFDLAITDLKKILTLKPVDEEDNTLFSALYQLGKTSVLSNENIDEGINSLQKFIETSPTHDRLPSKAWAKYRMGLLYVNKGDKKTAKALYKQAQNETQDETLLKNIKKSIKKV